jgi:hypothetical protein
LLLLDRLGSHQTKECLTAGADRGIDVLFLVPHSSKPSQPLEVLMFALMTSHLSGATSQHRGLREESTGPLRGTLEAWGALPEGVKPTVRYLRRWPRQEEGGDKAPFQPEGWRSRLSPADE